MLGALAVVTTHVGFSSGASLNTPFAGLLARLDVGVALFFVISGFLLYRPHARARMSGTIRPSTGRYLKHRALRILPALWVTVFLAAVLVPGPTSDAASYLRVATLTQIYTEQPFLPGLTQMWSLATEVAFYLLLPLLAWLLGRTAADPRRWSRATIGALIALAVLSALWVAGVAGSGGGVRGLWLPAYLGWFGIGMALATWHVAREVGVLPKGWVDNLASAPGTAYAAAGAVFLVLSTPLAGPFGLSESTALEAVVKNTGYGVVGCLLVIPAISPEGAGTSFVRALGSRAGRAFGDISYGVFCYHLIALLLVERVIGHEAFTGNFHILWLGTVAITLPVAWLSYRFMERPIMRRGRRAEVSST